MRIIIFSIGFTDTTLAHARSICNESEVILFGAKKESTYFSDTRDDLYDKLPDNIKVEKFFFPRARDLRCIFLNREIVQKIKYYDPDVIHIQANGYPWFFMASEFLNKYKIVNTIHDPQTHLGDGHTKGNFLPSYFVKRFTDHFIVHGEKMKDKIVEKYKLSESKVSSIPLSNFSTYDYKNQENFDEKKNHILFFGRIWKYKGLEYLIKAEPMISKYISDYKIVIAGTGEKFGIYQKMINNKDKFVIKNYKIPESEISEIFQKSSLVVLPYIEATQSGIIPMAYASGKPVIVTNVGSLPEYVIHGETGLIVKPRSVREIAKSIIVLLRNKNLRLEMGNNSYQYGLDKLSDSALSKMNLEIYKKVRKLT